MSDPDTVRRPHPDDDEELEIEPAFLLWQASHVAELAMDARLSEFGLTLPLFSTLYRLADRPDSSMYDLARFTFTSPQNMSGAISRLERLGYVERERHPYRPRMIAVQITPAGEAALQNARARVYEVQDVMLASFAPEELTTLSGLLRRCRDAVRGR